MIKSYLNSNYAEDPIRKLHFETSENVCFFYGASHYPFAGHEAKNIKDMKKVIFMSEENYDFSHIESSGFDKVLIIHKGIDRWRNLEINKNLYEYVYFPLPEKVANQAVNYEDKIFDVAYAGHVSKSQQWIMDLINVIKHKNYAFISATNNKYVTHKNVSYEQKIKTLCQSKVAIVHNIHFGNINKSNRTFLNSMNQNLESFKRCESWYDKKTNNWRSTRPELKTRIFEASAAGCVPLVLEDCFYSVEDFFSPNEDFLYFNKENFKEILDNVLNNYGKYRHIAESAKEKCKKYTDKEFSKTYLQNL